MPAQMVWESVPSQHTLAGDRLIFQLNQSRTLVHHYQERVVGSGLVYTSVSPLCLYGQAFQLKAEQIAIHWDGCTISVSQRGKWHARWLAILSEYKFRLSIVQVCSTNALPHSPCNVVMHQSKQWQPMLLQQWSREKIRAVVVNQVSRADHSDFETVFRYSYLNQPTVTHIFTFAHLGAKIQC